MSDNRLALSVAVAMGEDHVKRSVEDADWRGSRIDDNAAKDIFREALAEVWKQLLKTHAIVPRVTKEARFLVPGVAPDHGQQVWEQMLKAVEVKP